MYEAIVDSTVEEELLSFVVRCTIDNGEECGEHVVDSFAHAVELLSEYPQRGVQRLADIPSSYRAIRFWKHKWLVYLIDEESSKVYIDYLIDDRSNYGRLLK